MCGFDVEREKFIFEKTRAFVKKYKLISLTIFVVLTLCLTSCNGGPMFWFAAYDHIQYNGIDCAWKTMRGSEHIARPAPETLGAAADTSPFRCCGKFWGAETGACDLRAAPSHPRQ